jgi:hypothetical protein
MRYLAGLARETTARVGPRRAPSWLDSALPFAAHSVAWAADSGSVFTGEGLAGAHDASGSARQAAGAPAEGMQAGGAEAGGSEAGGAEASAAESGGIESNGAEWGAAERGSTDWTRDPAMTDRAARGRSADFRRSNSNPSIDTLRRRLESSALHAISGAAATGLRAASEGKGSSHRPMRDAAGRELRGSDAAAREAVAIRDASARPSAVAGINHDVTLQSVLGELARRQQLLDERQATLTAGTRAAPRESSNRSSTARDADEARLDIGSIVVQVMPEPPASPAPRRVQPRATSATDRRWARSFLDR